MLALLRKLVTMLRKLVTIVAVAVICTVGVMTPRLTYAFGHAAQVAVVAGQEDHPGHVDASAISPASPCGEQVPLHDKGKSHHPCCATACAGMAFLATEAAFNLSSPPLTADRWLTVAEACSAAPAMSIERPPRAA